MPRSSLACAALLLLCFYFLGCFLGCLVRRTFFAHTLADSHGELRPATIPVAMPGSATPVPQAPQRMPAQQPAATARPAPTSTSWSSRTGIRS